MGAPVLQLRSSNGESWLTLRAAETSATYPSVRFIATVTDGAFTGACESAWVEIDELARFTNELRACEQKRDGVAKLTAMSPEELSLVVARADVTGHFDLTYQVGSYGRTRSGPATNSVSGVFGLDSEYLGEVAAAAEAVLEWARASLEHREVGDY